MALGALIGAYQEDDRGGLRALLPLAGRTLVEYQARCAAAAGAAPIVVLVERVPVALQEAFERLRQEGVTVVPVSDGNEAASRFEAGTLILEIADGIAPDIADINRLAELGFRTDLAIAGVEVLAQIIGYNAAALAADLPSLFGGCAADVVLDGV